MAERVHSENFSGFIDVPTSLNPFPVDYSHQLLISTGNDTCGATLITAFMALTAAHCVSRVHPSKIMVFTANNSGKQNAVANTQSVKKLIIHEMFNEHRSSNLAILVFKTAFSGTGFPMIPNKSTVFQDESVVVRWTDSKTPTRNSPEYFLGHLSVSIVSSSQCQLQMGNGTTNTLCLEQAVDLCFDDSSSQLLCSITADAIDAIYLCGIFSWSMGCSEENPAVFTEIAAYQEWIDKNIRENSPIDGVKKVPISGCRSKEFQCDISKECKQIHEICDGIDDCKDGSDEQNCRSNNGCHPLQFPCRRGNECISKLDVCNGFVNCRDSSDEANCTSLEAINCTLPQFHCRFTKQCISENLVCNGFHNCGFSDMSDEENCKDENGCHPTQFACHLGNKCISKHKKCDGENDCLDGSDEYYCQMDLESKCEAFYCNITKKCIPVIDVCDGRWDCGGGDTSDEDNCKVQNGCHPTQFPCRKGNKCIPGDDKCDGFPDCSDRSDERDCPYQSMGNCSAHEFLCHFSKKCIPLEKICDGFVNCGETDESDEENCRVNEGCHPTQFSCRKGNKCIEGKRKCDRNSDCKDNSDEDNCSVKRKYCGRNGFFCNITGSEGGCYSFSDICDVFPNCRGMDVPTDEANCAPGVSGCAWNQFACRGTQQCIPAERKCDNGNDCNDGSDEEFCNLPESCHWTQFHCRNDSKCLPNTYKCNRRQECSDGSDEENCEEKYFSCQAIEFQCSEDGSCIPGHWKCNGKKDCTDGSDEENCQIKTNLCKTRELPCNKSRNCYSLLDICDGKANCGKTDSTDEENCILGTDGCHWNQIPCQLDRSCIPGIHKCNGKKDCADGSDEENCHDGIGCHWTQFVCKNDRKCIRSDYKCDGKKDCEDGSDEEDCESVECDWNKFQCHDSHECLPGHFKCDEKEDCLDGSDEKDCIRFVPKAFSATMLIIYITVPSVGVAVLAVALIFIVRKYRQEKDQLSDLEIKLFEEGDEKLLRVDGFAHENAEFTPYNRKFEVNWKNLAFSEESKIGEGAYGVVYKGHLESNPEEAIAIKTVRRNVDRSILKALLSELKIMIYLERHENIVELLGACTEFLSEGRIYIMLEYCSMGSLLSYLRGLEQGFSTSTNMFPQSNDGYICCVEMVQPTEVKEYLLRKDMMRWSIQIARAMQYLEFKKVIHGDLATRNVLVYSKDVVKITDFGLSRQLLNYDDYVKKTQERLPWRWLALETLKSFAFSHKSDVWSYGITLWEIFSMGQVPYTGVGGNADLVGYLENGYRLLQPKFASGEIYDVMLSCWIADKETRPDFRELEEMLRNVE